MALQTRSSNNKSQKSEVRSRKKRATIAVVMGATLGGYLLGYAIHSQFQNLFLTLVALFIGSGIGILGMLKAFLSQP